MKIQFMSDLHMEFSENSRYIRELEIPVMGDILVLAGDTAYLRDVIMPNISFGEWASSAYQQVLLIPGSHEFYVFGDVTKQGDCWKRLILHNVEYYQNQVLCIDDTDLFYLHYGHIFVRKMNITFRMA